MQVVPRNSKIALSEEMGAKKILATAWQLVAHVATSTGDGRMTIGSKGKGENTTTGFRIFTRNF
jgi:hypothetical protein